MRCGLLWNSFLNHVSIIGIVDLVEWLCWGLLLNAYPNRLHDRDWLLDEWIHTHGDVCDWLHWLGEFYHVFVGFLDKLHGLYYRGLRDTFSNWLFIHHFRDNLR